MATLEQQRRAIGAAMVARRGTGAQAQAARRAIGTAMVERRTGKSSVEDINSLVTTPRQSKTLEAIEPRGGVAAKQGRGDYSEPATSGGGVASPLTEVTISEGGSEVADREYYADGLVSSDGLFVLPAIKQQKFLDANGEEVVFNFAQPGMLP